MRVISHRGQWATSSEKNRRVAFVRSFAAGFGTETDVRDLAGRLVISHDPPSGDELSLDELLIIHGARRLLLAMNIKADGIAEPLAEAMRRYGIEDWFLFDASVPELVRAARARLPFFTRMSEFERSPSLLEQARGVWLDAFEEDWYTPSLIEEIVRGGKEVCIVSPELHGRPPEQLWWRLRDSGCAARDRVILCTDWPMEAAAYFGVRR